MIQSLCWSHDCNMLVAVQVIRGGSLNHLAIPLPLPVPPIKHEFLNHFQKRLGKH